jgi:hypothetical protein
MTLAAEEFIRCFLTGFATSAIRAFLPTADVPKSSHNVTHCSRSPLIDPKAEAPSSEPDES